MITSCMNNMTTNMKWVKCINGNWIIQLESDGVQKLFSKVFFFFFFSRTDPLQQNATKSNTTVTHKRPLVYVSVPLLKVVSGLWAVNTQSSLSILWVWLTNSTCLCHIWCVSVCYLGRRASYRSLLHAGRVPAASAVWKGKCLAQLGQLSGDQSLQCPPVVVA